MLFGVARSSRVRHQSGWGSWRRRQEREAGELGAVLFYPLQVRSRVLEILLVIGVSAKMTMHGFFRMTSDA